MPGVLVDVPTVDLVLVGPVEPRAVQVTLEQVTPGQTLEVIATAAGQSRHVRGGRGLVTQTRMVLVDVATALNTPVSYTVVLDGVPFTVGEITVPYPGGEYVLQALDGRTVFPFAWHGAADPRDLHMRTVTFDVPGRSDALVRWDVAGGESGRLPMRTTKAVTEALRTHLRTRGPVLLLRTDGAQLDIPGSEYIAVTRAPRETFGFDGTRLWTLEFEAIADPEPGSALAAVATPEDFDEVYAAATAEDFDTEWAAATAEDFDAMDWTQR